MPENAATSGPVIRAASVSTCRVPLLGLRSTSAVHSFTQAELARAWSRTTCPFAPAGRATGPGFRRRQAAPL